MTLDLVIRNGTIVDGSGMGRYRADVGVADGQIVEIVLHVGLSILTSYLNKVGDTDIDFPAIKTRRFNHKENCHG